MPVLVTTSQPRHNEPPLSSPPSPYVDEATDGVLAAGKSSAATPFGGGLPSPRMTAETFNDHDVGGGGGEKKHQQPGPKTPTKLPAHRPVDEERKNQNQEEGDGGGREEEEEEVQEERQASEAKEDPAGADVVRANEVSGWEQAMPLHRRTGSDGSGSGGARSGGSRKRSWSSSSSSSPPPPSSARIPGENKKHAVSPSGRRQLAGATTAGDAVAGGMSSEREDDKDKVTENYQLN